MNNLRKIILSAFFLLGITGMVFAASDSANHQVTLQINEVVLIDLNDTGLITLSTSAPTNGGEDPVGSTDASKLLQYTSLVAGVTTRSITAAWGGGDAAPSGTSLKLQATSVPVNCGTAGAQITLSGTGQNIITAIGSCATGTGANGAEMTYTFSIDDVTSISVGDSNTVTITFTLTDAS